MIEFENGWEKYAINPVKSEALARGLIRNAAVALANDHAYPELMFWIEAAMGGAGVLNVRKGLHSQKGVFDEVMHLTMCLYSHGSKKGSLEYENTAFQTYVHLDTTVLNPKAAPEEYQFQPTSLSYKTAWHKSGDKGFTKVAIVGARILTNNLK